MIEIIRELLTEEQRRLPYKNNLGKDLPYILKDWAARRRGSNVIWLQYMTIKDKEKKTRSERRFIAILKQHVNNFLGISI